MEGYILVNCTGLDLTKTTSQTITGLYNKVKHAVSSGKLILATNCSWGALSITPIPVFAIDFGTYFICTSSTLQIQVTSADVVTITNLVS